ncbi:MAG: outer membrane beta-barrel protein [Bradyrhizobium sp.]|nr:outer membrane beta-barrel protein [Pseudomonadota bacterium]MDE2473354.1 outer membrane beta-barrel protein [Bradyrhizobium sp.]
MLARRLGGALFTTFVLGLSPAWAQAIPATFEETPSPWNALRLFDPTPLPTLANPKNGEAVAPEDTPVRTRQQPGYEPVGIRDGSWMFLPSVLTGGFYDSNVFSSNFMKRSDIAAVVEPALRAYTLWGQHGIDMTLDAQEIAYSGNPGLDQTNASLKGNAWYDISHDLQLLTNFQIAHLNLAVGSLSSPTGAVQPTPYDYFTGDVSLRKEFNRLTASIGFRTDSYEYGSTRSADGTVIDQSSLSGQVYSLHGRADYAISPNFGWFAAAESNERDVRGLPGQPLDSQGFRAISGVTFGLNDLITGEIGGGYIQQRFVDPTIGTVEGPSYRAMLTWRPTRLLDIHFKAEQLVTELAQTSSTGVLANAVQLGLDYELRRNVIASLTGGYEVDRFFGMMRKDDVSTVDARVKYLLNRFNSIAFYYQYTNRNSDVPIFSYDKHQVGINVTTQF